MRSASHDLDRFVRAVHRRWVLVRAAEHVGMCVAGGCILSLLFLPILLWEGEAALRVVGVTMLIAAVAGLVAGVVRRPDLMSAAGEADRQLDLADLLSTALSTRDRSPSEPWAAVVIATADARCRTLAANEVILNRFGVRAWGGIGLAAALVLTLGLMSANPRSSIARAPAASNDLASTPAIAARHPNVSQNSHVPSMQSRHDVNQRADTAIESSNQNDATGHENLTGGNDRATRSSTGDGGAGLATSHAPSNPSLPVIPMAGHSRSADHGSADHGEAAGGGQTTARGDGRGDAAAGSSVVNNRAARTAPPWQSSSWPAARDEALSAVRDGRVPDAYRDLIRAYFTAPAQ